MRRYSRDAAAAAARDMEGETQELQEELALDEDGFRQWLDAEGMAEVQQGQGHTKESAQRQEDEDEDEEEGLAAVRALRQLFGGTAAAASSGAAASGTSRNGVLPPDIAALYSLSDLDGSGDLSVAELTSLLSADPRCEHILFVLSHIYYVNQAFATTDPGQMAEPVTQKRLTFSGREVSAYLTTKLMCAAGAGKGHPPGRISRWRDGEGLSVKPKKGLGVLFYSRQEDGLMDTDMWHYTCPVHAGNKWYNLPAAGNTD